MAGGLKIGDVRKQLSRAAAGALMLLVRAYQVGLAPLLIGSCKFYPSCSDYFLEAVRQHGVVRGTGLGLRRLGRCHPFGPGGYDPVPPAEGRPDPHDRAMHQGGNPA